QSQMGRILKFTGEASEIGKRPSMAPLEALREECTARNFNYTVYSHCFGCNAEAWDSSVEEWSICLPCPSYSVLADTPENAALALLEKMKGPPNKRGKSN